MEDLKGTELECDECPLVEACPHAGNSPMVAVDGAVARCQVDGSFMGKMRIHVPVGLSVTVAQGRVSYVQVRVVGFRKGVFGWKLSR